MTTHVFDVLGVSAATILGWECFIFDVRVFVYNSNKVSNNIKKILSNILIVQEQCVQIRKIWYGSYFIENSNFVTGS